MTRAASSDIRGFYNPGCPSGGHQRKVTNQREVSHGGAPAYGDERLVVNCPACEPLLIGKDSWGTPTAPPLTAAEQEVSKAKAEQAQALAGDFMGQVLKAAQAQVAAKGA